MKNAFKKSTPILVGSLLIIGITASAWQFKDKKQQDSTKTGNNYRAGDTTNPKQSPNDSAEFRMKDLDESMQQLDKQMGELDINLKDLDINIEKIVKDALAGIDFTKI